MQSAAHGEAMLALRAFLFANVYGQGPLRAEAERAGFVVQSLFDHFCDHPDELPPSLHGDPHDHATRVTDHVAGMTDRFATNLFLALRTPALGIDP